MRKLKNPITILGIASYATTLVVANHASAQPLEEVVITAQKRAENLQDVPVSVTALSAGELQALKYRDSTEIAAQVPNLQASNPTGDGFPIFSLRGISMSDFSLNQSSPVASYVDEVYKGNPAIQGVQIYDLERIEVLRGPQGTLYGKNSTGGAINFITRKPDFERSGYITIGAGDYSRKETAGAVNLPVLDDTLAVRLAGTWTEADGWFDNKNPLGIDDGNAIDEYGLRGSVLWQPSDSLDVLLIASTGNQDAVNYGIQAYNITADGVGAGLYGLYNMLGATTAVDSTRQGLSYFEFDSDQQLHRKIDNSAVALTINWSLNDELTLTSISSWDDGNLTNPEDVDGTANEVLRARYSADAKQITQDLRLTSNHDGPFNYITGLYYAKEEISNQTTLGFYQDLDMNADGLLNFNDCLDPLYINLGLGPATQAGAETEAILNGLGLSLGDFSPAGCQAQNNFDQDRTSMAAYADTTYEFGEGYTLHLGLRYNQDKTELHNFTALLLGNDGIPLLNTIPGDENDPYATAPNDSFTDKQWTGVLGLDYMTAGGTLYYGSYSYGYRTGAFNAQAFFDPAELTTVDPETLDAFELGFKSELLDGSMQLNGAVFFYRYHDQQFLNVDPVTLAQTLVNIDKSEIAGGELELTYRPLPTLLLRSGLGYLDSEVKKGELNGIDLQGNELVNSPELNFNITADWDVLQVAAGTLTLHMDSSYSDSHYFDVFNVNRLQQGGFWLTNARVQFSAADDSWEVALWSKNIADKKYRTSIIDLQSSFGFDYSHIGAPRTFGADLTLRF